MPRRIRPDLEPEISLPDTGEQQHLASSVIDQENYNAIVYAKNSSIGREPRMYIFNTLEERLQDCRGHKEGIDEGLLFMMINLCDLVDKRLQRDSNGDPIIKDDQIVHRLVRVGCRARITQEELSQRYGTSRQYVNEQIKKFKENYLIVNQGKGWYEFDARLCWRGDLGTCDAYRQIQKVWDGLVYTDGKTTLVTESADEVDVREIDRNTAPKG